MRFILSSKTKRVAACILLACLIGFIGYRVGVRRASSRHHSGPLRLGRDSWTNPLIVCSTDDRKDEQAFGVLQMRLQHLLQQEKTAGHIAQASVYIRDLEKGRAMGIDENESYAAASLIKLPILLAYLKRAEIDPSVLKQALYYDGSFDLNPQQNMKPAEILEKGKSYSVEELLRRMVVYSANNSTILLLNALKEDGLRAVYRDLSLPFEFSVDHDLLLSPRNYALFFRTLYSATYLTREMSEKALEALNQVDFRQGLAAGVPQEVRVSHKFGERVLENSDGTSYAQLHDCGIIYHATHRYIICVMTKGTSLSALPSVIANISKTTYAFIDKEYHP